jgi:hypothetical protein
MVKKTKKVAKPATVEATVSFLKPLDNTEIKMSPEIRSMMRKRQKDTIKHYNATSELLQAKCESPKERSKREQVLKRIAKKLGIYEELLELKSIDLERKKRWRKVLSKVEISKLE